MANLPTVLGAAHGRVLFLAVREAHPDFKADAFAAFVGVEPRYLSEMANGKRDLTAHVMVRLAEYLDDWALVFRDVLARGGCTVAALDDVTSEDEQIAQTWRAVGGRGK